MTSQAKLRISLADWKNFKAGAAADAHTRDRAGLAFHLKFEYGLKKLSGAHEVRQMDLKQLTKWVADNATFI